VFQEDERAKKKGAISSWGGRYEEKPESHLGNYYLPSRLAGEKVNCENLSGILIDPPLLAYGLRVREKTLFRGQ